MKDKITAKIVDRCTLGNFSIDRVACSVEGSDTTYNTIRFSLQARGVNSASIVLEEFSTQELRKLAEYLIVVADKLDKSS